MPKKFIIVQKPKTDPAVLKALHRLQMETGFKQKEIADKMGLTDRSQYSKKIRGVETITVQDFLKLISIYRTHIDAEDLNQILSTIFGHKITCFLNASGDTRKLIAKYEHDLERNEKTIDRLQKKLDKAEHDRDYFKWRFYEGERRNDKKPINKKRVRKLHIVK